MAQYHEIIAFLLARIFLGLLFLFQGYDAVFNIRIKNVVDTYDDAFEKKGIPRQLTILGSWFTSLSELIGGGLLVFGLFTYPVLYILGLNMIVASLAFGINTPMWDMKYVFPRFVLLIFLLVCSPAWNSFSLDYLIFK